VTGAPAQGEGPPATFPDPARQQAFERDGVVVVPLLGPDEVRSLRDEIERLLPHTATGFTGNHQGDTPEVRRACSDAVRRHVEPAAARLLPGHEFHATAVFVKPPTETTEKPLHQHWTFVDEERFTSGLVWVALDDTDRRNGGLHVVLGSHRLRTGVRGTPDLHPPMDGTEAGAVIYEDYLTPMDLPAGTAAVMDDRLLHGSTPNRSGAARVAVGLAFRPAGAPLHHYHLDPEEGLLRFTVTPEFFQEHDWPRRPDGPWVLGVAKVDEAEPPDLLEQVRALLEPVREVRPPAGTDGGSAA
jgi:hypothetical protein